MKLYLFLEQVVEDVVCQPEGQNARRPVVRPEDDNLAARPQYAVKLAKHLPNLTVAEMFNDPEVVDAIEALVFTRQIKDAGVFQMVRVWIVAKVELQRFCR